KNFSHGYNNSTKRLKKYFNYSFSMDFNSTAERDNYESDPININIAKQHLLPLINKTESILVFDF
ncbi:Dabb family protein, partial [Francisella tularensis]|uniref:Dabb family protein n=1 Tax=Francisella tularensis TaxID=263 RepID=UPI002381A42A